jgi:hypothetical protein
MKWAHKLPKEKKRLTWLIKREIYKIVWFFLLSTYRNNKTIDFLSVLQWNTFVIRKIKARKKIDKKEKKNIIGSMMIIRNHFSRFLYAKVHRYQPQSVSQYTMKLIRTEERERGTDTGMTRCFLSVFTYIHSYASLCSRIHTSTTTNSNIVYIYANIDRKRNCMMMCEW